MHWWLMRLVMWAFGGGDARPLPRVEWTPLRRIPRKCVIARSRSRDEPALQGAMDLSDQYCPTACVTGLFGVPLCSALCRLEILKRGWTRRLLALSRGFDPIDLSRRPAA